MCLYDILDYADVVRLPVNVANIDESNSLRFCQLSFVDFSTCAADGPTYFRDVIVEQ